VALTTHPPSSAVVKEKLGLYLNSPYKLRGLFKGELYLYLYYFINTRTDFAVFGQKAVLCTRKLALRVMFATFCIVKFPVSLFGEPSSIPIQSIRNFWCTKWPWGKFFSENFRVTMPGSLDKCPVLVRACCSYWKDKWPLGNLPQSSAF